MGTQSSGCYATEYHQNSEPFVKKCDECKAEFPLRAIFFPANWMHDGLVCGKCYDDYTQLEIEELGLEEFIKRFAPEQLTNA